MRRAVPVLTSAVVLSAVAAGLYGRLGGFGLRPLATDEYYFVQSIELILDQGVPRFLSGGFYVRGILVQYLTAATTFVLGSTEFAFRFPSLLFSLGSVLAAYFYGRRVVGVPAATAVALTLLVSSWHIEFARFARMYSAFQFVTLLSLISVDDAYFRSGWTRRYMPHLWVIVAVLVHELGILLAPMVFLPLLTPRDRTRFPTMASYLRFGLAGVATLASCLLYQRAGLRSWGVTERFPEGYTPPDSPGLFRLPDFPFWSIGENAMVSLAVLCGALLATALVVLAWRFKGSGVTTTDLLAALLVVAAAAHSLVLFGALLAVLVLRYRLLEPGRHPRRVYIMVGLSCLLAAGWFAYALSQPEVLGYTPGGPSVPELIRRAFFGWPDFYIPLWLPCVLDFPVLSVLFVIAVAYHAVTKLSGEPSDWMRHPAFFVLYIAFCIAVLQAQYAQTRYLFFVYPVILLVIASAVVDAAEKLGANRGWPRGTASRWIGAPLFVCLFLVSTDFNPRHIARVATDEVAYRMGRFARFRNTWYARLDYRSAAEFVNLHDPDDGRSKIVVAGDPPVSYYLRRDHAIYIARSDVRFQGICRERGTVELWSNRHLLSTPEELGRHTANAGIVWIVENPHSTHARFEPESVWGSRIRSISVAHRTVDERLQVTKVLLDEPGL